jgi:anti-anti-sigma factor
MPDTELAVSTRVREGVPILDLSGEVNSSAEEALDAAFTKACRTGPSAVLLNFRSVTYINSTGIALIVALLARARKARVQLLVTGLSEHYRHIFRITRLVDFMTIRDDEADAIAAASPAASES